MVSLETKVRIFQYKLLILTKCFSKVGSSPCFFGKTVDETSIHLFCEFPITYQLWNYQLSIMRCFFESEFNFPSPTQWSAISGLNDLTDNFTLLRGWLYGKFYPAYPGWDVF